VRILVAEDEALLADAVARGLREWGMAVDIAADGREALLKSEVYEYDVVVLDRDLPEVHGDEVCRRLAAFDERPRILMLTAATAVDDVVGGLAIGADDYLRKPFAFRELVARVTVLASRVTRARSPVLVRGELTLDPLQRRAWRDGRDLELTPKELTVLRLLLEAGGAVLSPDELIHRAWDERADPLSNTLRMVVMGLRRKVGEPQLIETVRGFGYQIA
jgi:DNA-binding response OmpR family regulator